MPPILTFQSILDFTVSTRAVRLGARSRGIVVVQGGLSEGERIVNLRRNGHPLAPDEKLRIAVNNYRAGGSGGYTMFRGAKILWKSPQDIRSLIITYYAEQVAGWLDEE